MPVLVRSGLGLLVFLKSLSVVTNKDNQCLVRHAEVVESLEQLAQPSICEANSVEVAVELLVPLHLAVGVEIVCSLERFGDAPRVVSCAVFDMALECRLGETEIVDLLKVVLVVLFLLKTLPCDSVLESDLLIELVLTIVAIGDGLEESRLGINGVLVLTLVRLEDKIVVLGALLQREELLSNVEDLGIKVGDLQWVQNRVVEGVVRGSHGTAVAGRRWGFVGGVGFGFLGNPLRETGGDIVRSEEGGEDEEGGYNGEDGPCSRLGSSLFTRLSLDEMGAFFGIFNIVVEFAARVRQARYVDDEEIGNQQRWQEEDESPRRDRLGVD
ncbi:hypothetical protein HG531_001386 [Fusarium graminearum]|nr:hypothetical protein HG531_001386 [Fusarium graminearum]